jgi:hypothetical protein
VILVLTVTHKTPETGERFKKIFRARKMFCV